MENIERESIMAVLQVDYGFLRAAAKTNVWDPYVEVPQEFSIGRIALAARCDLGMESLFVGAKDSKTNNWWVTIADIDVGYWPGTLFTYIKDYATHVEWGGEVISISPQGRHTKTQMGSGHFPVDGMMKKDVHRVVYLSNIKYINGNGDMKWPAREVRFISRRFCYGYISWGKAFTAYEYLIFYGGPGGAESCCIEDDCV